MVDDFIAVDGAAELSAKLNKLPEAVQDAVIDEVNPYLVNVLKAYPAYRYISFKQAYGGFFSEKQRKYVMARIREGSIRPGQPNRTQRMARGWKVLGGGRNSLIVNETPYAPYLMSDSQQARMPAKIGWKKLMDVIKNRMKKIQDKADAGAKKAIKRLGL